MLKAEVLDASRCVDVCEDVFKLLADGDYLMGGSNHNSHGMGYEMYQTAWEKKLGNELL